MLILVEVVQIVGQPCQYKITTEIDYVVSVSPDIVTENIIKIINDKLTQLDFQSTVLEPILVLV